VQWLFSRLAKKAQGQWMISMFSVSALSFLQSSDIVAWLTGQTSGL